MTNRTDLDFHILTTCMLHVHVEELADGRGAFLFSAGENQSCLAISHGTQYACGESAMAEDIVGLCSVRDKCGDTWRQGFVILL